MRSIVFCQAFGSYWEAVKSIIEGLGYKALAMDEGPSKANIAHFHCYDQLKGLDPNRYAVWGAGDKDNIIFSSNPDLFPNPIYTMMKDVVKYVDKVDCRELLPEETDFIRYPKIHELVLPGKVIVKPRIASGTAEHNRMLIGTFGKNYANDAELTASQYKNSDRLYCVDYINHLHNVQMIAARFEKGKLVEFVPFIYNWDGDSSRFGPNEWAADVAYEHASEIIEWTKKLGELNQIDGIIDVEFLIDKFQGALWFAESNPRQDGNMYNVVRPMIERFLKQRVNPAFWTEELAAVDINQKMNNYI